MDAKHAIDSTNAGARLLAATLVLGMAPVARAADGAFVPVRREARIELGVLNNVYAMPEASRVLTLQVFGTSDPGDLDYFAADLILPRATTDELARYARHAGRRAGARWFCAAYAAAPADAPTSASLRTLLVRAAAEGGTEGARAGDALVCPRHAPRRGAGSGGDDYGFFDWFVRWLSRGARLLLAAVGEEGHRISTSACAATDGMRAGFDQTACEDVLRGRVFAVAVARAARRGACLRLRVGAHRPLPGTMGGGEFFEVGVATAGCD